MSDGGRREMYAADSSYSSPIRKELEAFWNPPQKGCGMCFNASIRRPSTIEMNKVMDVSIT